MNLIQHILDSERVSNILKGIALKILKQDRISDSECLYLFTEADLSYLGILANYVKQKKYGSKVYFNRNFHIEPTNVCIFSCKFCSYSRSYKHKEEGWEFSIDQMMDIVKTYDNKFVTEVHIVGGVHPRLNLSFFIELIKKIKKHRPTLHIKGFTAVELDYMFRKAKLSITEGLVMLKESGLGSLPGGGAEIFDQTIRKQICADKVDANGWLCIHEKAHELDIPSNATMLYGHIENYEHRINHMNLLRVLQDRTKGFNAFIPLKFRNKNNEMSGIEETSLIEDLKMYAVSRIYLDNIPHIKAYWPMLGRNNAQLALSFGVDDLDGTIDDSTKIYSMAGSEEQNPSMSIDQIVLLINESNFIPVERDTIYNELNVF